MKKASVTGVGAAMLLFAVWGTPPSLAQVPGIINFQGRVAVGGTNFTGTGSFRFELVNGTGAVGYWSNDGGIPPVNPVSLPVSNGMFSAMLGDSNLTSMVAIPNSVFTNADVRLRVWFNGQQLSPDQRIAAVGYALMAANVAGGYVDLTSTQTISGVKLLTTNLLMRRGTNDAVRWGVGVGNFTDPESVVHPNVLLFSANEVPQVLMTPDGILGASNIWTRGEIDSDGDISTRGQVSSDGDINANGNIRAGGEIDGGDFHANGDISVDGGISVQSNVYAQGSISAFGDIVTAGNISANNINGGAGTFGSASAGTFTATDITATETVSAKQLYVSGTKNFVQPHPTDPSKEIVYTCLEGPEAGTYVRGSAEMVNGKAVITLPDNFGMVTSAKGLTVQLTPRGKWLELYVTTATVAQVTVGEAQGRSGPFDYLVQGVRLGYENQPVIRERRTTGTKP